MNFSHIAGMVDALKSWFEGWFGAVLSVIPKLVYQLITPMFGIIDLAQLLVRKLAGLESIASIDGSGEYTGDLVLYFINLIFSGNSPVLTNIFIALIVLGVLMLFITTFVAVLRSEYMATDAKSASKGKIIASALKAIASFVFIPVVCFFGMYLGNMLLNAIDIATTVSTGDGYYTAEYDENGNEVAGTRQNFFKKNDQGTYYNYSILGVKIPTKTTPISGLIFKSCAQRSNRARNSTKDRFYTIMMDNDEVAAGVFNKRKGTSEAVKEFNCNMMDTAFANTFELPEKVSLDRKPFANDHMFPFNGDIIGSIADNAIFESGVQYFDKNNTSLVWYYYDLWSFDYLVAIGSCIAVISLLLYIVFGLVKRFFELLVLFLVSAPIASLMPLDNGGALKKWREKFVAKAIGTYGPIAGMNLFFILMGEINKIQVVGNPLIDGLINIIFTIAGLSVIKDLSTLLSEIVGGDDTLKAGADKAQDVGSMAKKVGKVAGAVGGVAARTLTKGARIAKNVSGRVIKNERKKQAEAGEGRYAKGSASYDNAVENMADNVSDNAANEKIANSISDDIVTTSLANEMSDERAIQSIKKSVSHRDVVNHALGAKGGDLKSLKSMSDDEIEDIYNNTLSEKERSKSTQSLNKKRDSEAKRKFENMTIDEKENLKKDIAKNDFSKMTEEQKAEARNNIASQATDETRQEAKKTIAKEELDNMKWEDRQEIIDNNFRTRGQNERIRNRAKNAAGGEEKWKNLSAEEKNAYFNQSKKANVGFGTNNEKLLNAQKIIFGDSAGNALAKAFKDVGDKAFSFIGNTFDSMSGGYMKGAKGTLGDMLSAFKGETKKQVGVAEETKNQKKLMSAQEKARASLSAGKPAEPKQPETVKLDTSTISSIAKESAKAAYQANSNRDNSVKIDNASMDSLAEKIASKINNNNKN